VEIFRNSTWGIDNQKIFFDRTIPKEMFLANDGFKFTIDINKDSHRILERIDSLSVKLGSIYYVNYGAQVSSKSPGGFKKSEVVGDEKMGNAKKFVEGKDVARWKLRDRKLWLDYRKDEMYGPRSEELFENPKILFRKVSDKNHKLAGTIDYDGYYTDDGVVIAASYDDVSSLKQEFVGIEREDINFSIEYVAAQLFNCITDYYFKNKFATESLQGATSHTYPKTVRQLPIFRSPKNVEETLSTLVKYILFLRANDSDDQLILNFFLELLEGIQFDLYFSQELKQAGKEIIKHVGKLKPLDIEMNSVRKLAIMQKEFDRLYDPDHPVRNNLETLDNIEEIRIIKEAVR